MASFLFKFAVDRDYIFDGDHHYAAKVAGRLFSTFFIFVSFFINFLKKDELKGLKAFFSVGIPQLHFPLVKKDSPNEFFHHFFFKNFCFGKDGSD